MHSDKLGSTFDKDPYMNTEKLHFHSRFGTKNNGSSSIILQSNNLQSQGRTKSTNIL